jgi:hypothetical protein
MQFLLATRYDPGERWFVDAGVHHLLDSTIQTQPRTGSATVPARFRTRPPRR